MIIEALSISLAVLSLTLLLWRFFLARLYIRPSTSPAPSILIVYATESGTAERFATDLTLTLRECNPTLLNAKDQRLNLHLQQANYLLFVVSTYGEGEGPEDAQQLVQLLLEKPSMEGKHFAVFGLGDSSYRQYNAFSKWCNSQLIEAKAAPLLPLALGDAFVDIEADYAHWKQQICAEFHRRGLTREISTSAMLIEKFTVREQKGGELPLSAPSIKRSLAGSSVEAPLTARIHSLEAVGEGDSSTYYKVVFFVQQWPRMITLQAGDHLGLVVQNDSALCERMIQKLSLSPSARFSLLDNAANGEVKFAGTALELFSKWIDLHATVGTDELKQLKRTITDSVDSDTVLELINEWTTLVEQESLTPVHVLEMLQNTLPTVQTAVNLASGRRLQPRLYSIAAVDKNAGLITCIFKEITWNTPLNDEVRFGVATGHLLSMPEEVKLYFKPSSFHLFKHADRPIIMIGNGAGIAPYIGFMHSRLAVLESKKRLGEALMFFGCHTPEHFPMRSFFEDCVRLGVLTGLYPAYSRTDSSHKVYVQHLLLAQAAQCYDLVCKKRAIVYVCGSAHGMGQEVRAAWKQIFALAGAVEGAVEEFLGGGKQYIEDVY